MEFLWESSFQNPVHFAINEPENPIEYVNVESLESTILYSFCLEVYNPSRF